MGISKLVLHTTDRLRPLLVKIIPKKILSGAKKRFLNLNVKQLSEIRIEPFNKNLHPSGINLIGNIKGDSGLGQSCRLVAKALENCNYPLCIIEHSISSNLSMLDTTYDNCLEKTGKYGINLFHINPHEFVPAYLQLGKKVWDAHYNIAYWLWELEDFPDEWVSCINLLDEIWTPAEYISRSIRKKTDKPVITVPYYVTAPTKIEFDRAYFGLPENEFLFLMMFDCGSMIERKNPRAVIEAFKIAFGERNQTAGLVIKINGGSVEDIELIKSCAGGINNIHLINEVFSKLEINSLIKCVNAVVSLHRAEGFGLVLAEAMINGIPCIATNWSANIEFMNTDVACMVDYKMVVLDKDIGPYRKGNHWAEPDITQAAMYMRRLYEDSEYCRRMAENAQEYIDKQLSLDRAVMVISDRVSVIYGDKVDRCEYI